MGIAEHLLCNDATARRARYCALTTALLGSLFLYTAQWELDSLTLNTIAGVWFVVRVLSARTRTWIMTGSLLGILWFWWIAVSFVHYRMLWAIPFVLVGIAAIYGALFGTVALLSEKLSKRFDKKYASAVSLFLKGAGLWAMSAIHPFGFDWFKPELLFVRSYLGIDRIDFALIIAGAALMLLSKKPVWLVAALIVAWQPYDVCTRTSDPDILLVRSDIPVEKKWHRSKGEAVAQNRFYLTQIDRAIRSGKSVAVLPETAFPVYLNRYKPLYEKLRTLSQHIAIVTGALYLDGDMPKNAAYLFDRGHVSVAQKVILVPFGESNPLPRFLSDWVNRTFYGGAVDYRAGSKPTDFTIATQRYRSAICYEATSEALYRPPPKRMIVLSNNGWFVPSIEPTLQKIALEYYMRKYGTTIYHAVNGSPAYILYRCSAWDSASRL